MKKIQLTRDAIKGILAGIYETKTDYIRLQIQFNKQGDYRIAQVPYAKEQDNIIFTEPMVRIFNQMQVPNRYGRLGDAYEQLNGEQKTRIENFIYYTVNKKCETINRIGFVATSDMTGTIDEIVKQLKHVLTPMVTGLTYRELGVVDPTVIQHFVDEHKPYITNAVEVGSQGFGKKRDLGFFGYAVQLTKAQVEDARDRTFLERYGYIEDGLKMISRARTTQEETFFIWLRELKRVHHLTQGEIDTVLYTFSWILREAKQYTELVPYYGKKLQDYAQKYVEGNIIKSVEPVTLKGRPYLIVEADLTKIRYTVTRGNYVYEEYYTEKRGVKKLDDNKYIMTFNAFRDFEAIGDVYEALKFTEFRKGDWERVFEVGGEYFFNITPKFISKIKSGNETFTIYHYNSNKDSNNSLGMKLVLFTHTINCYTLGKEDDDYYDLLSEINEHMEFRTGYRELFNDYNKGYKIRHMSEEEELEVLAAKFEHTANRLNLVYRNSESQIIASFNELFKKSYTSISEINESDFGGSLGLDSGFVYFEYEDPDIQREYQAIKTKLGSNTYGIESRVNLMSHIQSVTLKRAVYTKLAYIFNQSAQYKLKVEFRYD